MWVPLICKAFHMNEGSATKTSSPKSREERLAAKLRENLRRRKAQSRAVESTLDESDAPTETLSNRADES